jgi:putative DNA methylase
MTEPKKLIEVAIPIKEISAESVRDKSIRHGHISTLHLWWARRPLPVCRAVVFASLVPDPLDENCPQAFKDSIEILLGKENNLGDPYHPYKDIPWTSVYDPMEDNLRNRLQMFIGKFTDEMQQHLLYQKPKPGANNQLNDYSLIKWDNKNNEAIINKARKLIWVAFNSKGNSTAVATHLLADFDRHYFAIKKAEEELYNIQDRHFNTENSQEKTDDLHRAVEAFLDKMPKVFDPFAGGGAIPLEAARLGCRTFGNDINPVAHIIQKGSLEFPQKFGKPITYSKREFEKLYGRDELVRWCKQNGKHADDANLKIEITNRLSFDVEFYAKKILKEVEDEIGHLYPADKKGGKPVAYYWVYFAKCSNPSCRKEVPLLKDYYLVNKSDKKVYLQLEILDERIEYKIKNGTHKQKATFEKKKLICPFCNNITNDKELKEQFANGKPSKRILAVITNDANGKGYRLPHDFENNIEERIERENDIFEEITKNDTRSFWLTLWGVDTWGKMFSNRQLHFLNILSKKITESFNKEESENKSYSTAVATYLAIWFDRIAVVNTAFGRWDVTRETLQHPYSRQGIAMTFDFPEVNPFSGGTGSSLNMLDWVTKYIESESAQPFIAICNNAASGERSQFPEKYLTSVVTDPPYYDAVPYADLSDFFYVWQKRVLGNLYPLNFATPKTPKSEECTALKHHHAGSIEKAKNHFENKLLQIFDAIEHQTEDVVSILFAHQSTEAWTTLCNSILNARMNITGSWAIDTEMTNRAIGLAGAALESSVTVSCRPSQRNGFGAYKTVKKEIEKTVAKEVDELYRLGFRGADLLTACFGQAVSEFGNMKR